jgi:acetyltransferase
MVFANLLSAGFPGRIVPVNPSAGTVQGVPAVGSVLDIEGPVDLAVLTVPAPAVLPALKDCVARGVGGAVVISAGFAEIGPDGVEREAELRAWVAAQPLRVLGPNCLGWIRPSARLNATFAPGMPLPGGIAFVSHSGALAVAILDWARDRQLGFSFFASLGNQGDLTEADLVAAAARDPETRVIAGYIEGVADGRRFLGVLEEAAALKPVVLLKVGRSSEGARAVSSHTGALAGSDRAFDAALRQAGALRARSVEELFDLARGLATQPLPRGRRLLIVTNGGGLGVVATDAARDAGLEVPTLPPATRRGLAEVLPLTASTGNPVDLVGDADAARFASALRAAGPEAADALLVLLTAQAATDSADVARAVAGTTRGWPIPLAASFVGGARVRPGIAVLEEAGVPCYPFPERAVNALAGMAELAGRRGRSDFEPAAPSPPAVAQEAARLAALGREHVGLGELARLLAAAGIPVVPHELAPTPEAAGAAARRLGGTVALKVVSPDIVHKTEVGGVRLGVSAEAAEAATRALLAGVRAAEPGARVEGVLVQRMAEPGCEMLLGMVRDAQFGPVVMVGMGGIYVEILQDTVVRVAPVGRGQARAMLEELRMAPLLSGARGRAPVDREALATVIERFARLAVDLPMLAELELNPLLAGPAGVVAVDARARCAGLRRS